MASSELELLSAVDWMERLEETKGAAALLRRAKKKIYSLKIPLEVRR